MAPELEFTAQNGMANAVLGVLRGGTLAAVAKASKVSVGTLSDACDRFIEAGSKAISLETPKGLDRRHEITWVAIRLFSERGFRSTRLEDISEVIGMTRPSLYYYFKNKDELLVAVAEEAVRERGQHGFTTPLASDENPVEELPKRVERRVRHLLASALPLHRMLLQERHELPAAATKILTVYEVKEARGLATLIQSGIDRGVFVDLPPVLVASSILSLIAGSARWFDPTRANADELAALTAQLVLHGLLRGTGATPKGAPAVAGQRKRPLKARTPPT